MNSVIFFEFFKKFNIKIEHHLVLLVLWDPCKSLILVVMLYDCTFSPMYVLLRYPGIKAIFLLSTSIIFFFLFEYKESMFSSDQVALLISLFMINSTKI